MKVQNPKIPKFSVPFWGHNSPHSRLFWSGEFVGHKALRQTRLSNAHVLQKEVSLTLFVDYKKREDLGEECTHSKKANLNCRSFHARRDDCWEGRQVNVDELL